MVNSSKSSESSNKGCPETYIPRTSFSKTRDFFSSQISTSLSSGVFISEFSDEPFVIGQAWRNKYVKSDWQDPHIHSGAQWSFVIYKSVGVSRTVFMNPARKVIMNQWGMYADKIPMDFVPEIPDGHIVIFPSWIEHFVMSGNEGETISGNVYLQEPPRGVT